MAEKEVEWGEELGVLVRCTSSIDTFQAQECGREKNWELRLSMEELQIGTWRSPI